MGKPRKHYGKWRVRYTDERGKRRSKTFTEKKTAELALKQAEILVEERKKGLRPLEIVPKTYHDIACYWEENRAPQKRSYKDDLSMVKQLREHFGALLLNDRGAWIVAIDRYVALKSHLNKKTICNHLTVLGTQLRLAVDLGWCESLPRIKKPRIRLVSKDYSYLRTDDEIRRFLAEAIKEGGMVFMMYLVAIYTGARAGELAGMEWSDVDFENRLITIQRSFDGPTKGDDTRHVPILDVLLPHLRRWRLEHPGRLVFTNRDGRMLQPAARVFQEVLHRVLDRGGFPKIIRGGKERRYIHFHDLRHTFASHWVMKGGDIFKLQKILGHKSIAMTMRYAHLAPDAFASDYGRLGASAIVEPGTVTQLPAQPTLAASGY